MAAGELAPKNGALIHNIPNDCYCHLKLPRCFAVIITRFGVLTAVYYDLSVKTEPWKSEASLVDPDLSNYRDGKRHRGQRFSYTILYFQAISARRADWCLWCAQCLQSFLILYAPILSAKKHLWSDISKNRDIINSVFSSENWRYTLDCVTLSGQLPVFFCG